MYQALARRGWSEAEFFALPDDEQQRIMDYEHLRRKRIAATLESITDGGTVEAGTVTAHMLIAMAMYS